MVGGGGAGATHSAFGEAEPLLDGRGQLADAAAVAGRQAARKSPDAAVNNKDRALRVLKVVAPLQGGGSCPGHPHPRQCS